MSWINHLPPACWSTFWKSIFKHQLGCRFDILDIICSFFILTYTIIYVLIHHIIFLAFSFLLEYSTYFFNSCTNIFRRCSLCIFYGIQAHCSLLVITTIRPWPKPASYMVVTTHGPPHASHPQWPYCHYVNTSGWCIEHLARTPIDVTDVETLLSSLPDPRPQWRGCCRPTESCSIQKSRLPFMLVKWSVAQPYVTGPGWPWPGRLQRNIHSINTHINDD